MSWDRIRNGTHQEEVGLGLAGNMAFPEAQLEHIWRGELLLFLLPGSGADSPFSLPASFECREFRRRWEPGPGWELSYSWGRLGMCDSAEEGRASLSPDLGGSLQSLCMCVRGNTEGAPREQSRPCGHNGMQLLGLVTHKLPPVALVALGTRWAT